jgi:hypothetical protein
MWHSLNEHHLPRCHRVDKHTCSTLLCPRHHCFLSTDRIFFRHFLYLWRFIFRKRFFSTDPASSGVQSRLAEGAFSVPKEFDVQGSMACAVRVAWRDACAGREGMGSCREHEGGVVLYQRSFVQRNKVSWLFAVMWR